MGYYYLLQQYVVPCSSEELHNCTDKQYVAVLTTDEWRRERNLFDLDIELEPDIRNIHNTKAEVNYGSLTGTFQILDRDDLRGPDFRFAYALDEKGIVFIDDSGKAEQMIETISVRKRWREPSLERFLYDFMELIIDRDLSIMERYEDELNHIEDMILSSDEMGDLASVNEIRGDIRKLLIHYEQIIDMAQELEENENDFFTEENLRYIHLFMNLMTRRHDTAVSIRDHTMQVRDLYNSKLEARQNNIMAVLTVNSTIFMPLTLIAGWYGMNFRYMPELGWRYGYLAVILLSVAVVVICLWFFKKKKWM